MPEDTRKRETRGPFEAGPTSTLILQGRELWIEDTDSPDLKVAKGERRKVAMRKSHDREVLKAHGDRIVRAMGASWRGVTP